MKLILIIFFLFSCGQTHSHKNKKVTTDISDPTKSFNLESIERTPLDLVLILKREKLIQKEDTKKLDQFFSIKCLQTCKIKRKVK